MNNSTGLGFHMSNGNVKRRRYEDLGFANEAKDNHSNHGSEILLNGISSRHFGGDPAPGAASVDMLL
jgi:hypothetical protein